MRIPVNTPRLDGSEAVYLAECVKSGWISSEGPFVERFEHLMADITTRQHAIAVANGTLALELAVAALNIEPQSEVIVPSFTIISCAAAVVRRGCVPVFVDVDPETWNMDPAAVERAISSRTRAIMVVHTYGLPCDMNPLLALARRHGLAIIEDAAEAIGQTYDGQPCGSFGDVSVLSFYANKHVTTGEGGMVLTNDRAIADRSRSLRNLCFLPDRRFFHEELGYNMRMTNLQAAVGVAQAERLEATVSRKRAIGALYQERLRGCSDVRRPLSSTAHAENVYWVYGLVLLERSGRNAADVMKALGERGVGTRPFFWPLHEQPVLQRFLPEGRPSLPVSEYLSRYGFYLPSGVALTDDEVAYAADQLQEVLAG